MLEFSYRAANRDGSVAEGSLHASNQAAALRELRSKGLTPLRVVLRNGVATVPAGTRQPLRKQTAAAHKPAGDRAATARVRPAPTAGAGTETAGPRHRKGVSRDDVQALTSDLAVLLRAGLNIDSALKVQLEMCQKPELCTLIQHLLETVKSGRSLSQGLEAYPDLFSAMYVSLVRAGEASGRMGEMLERLAGYLERVREVRSSVVSALIYPAILASVSVLSIAVMLGFVVPQFEALFADMGDALPGMTRVVITLGNGLKAYGWLLLLLATAVGYGLRSWLRRPEGRQWKDNFVLHLPVLGEVMFKYEMASFARTLGTLLNNGVSLLQAIGISLNTVENVMVRDALQILPPAVKGGRRMSEVMAESGVLTPMVVQMMRVGEESGRVDDMMLELARVYDRDVEAGVKRALTVLEPALILGMGLVIALIIISILMGILSVNDLAM